MARRKVAKKASQGERGLAARCEWISKRLERYSDGVHHMEAPATMLDSELPSAVQAVCREFSGATLFHESLVLVAGEGMKPEADFYLVAQWDGDDILVDGAGLVWRLERDTEELLPEGTRFDRWLAGAIDAEGVLYGLDGEFCDDVFDESGELTEAAEKQRARCQLRRDAQALAPRWRLARSLIASGRFAQARGLLEEVVSAKDDFPWAWFDLSRISEELGDFTLASEEAQHAAEVLCEYEHAVFFLAHAARLSKLSGDMDRGGTLAAEVLRREPDLPRRHVDAARSLIEAGDLDAARELLLLAKTVAPRDLQVLDLLSQLP